MNFPIGFVIVLCLVVGGYVLSGGKLDIIIQALPYESMMIGGMALGATIIANSFSALKKILSGIGRILKGERWKRGDYEDTLLLLFEIAKVRSQKGMGALDAHVESPSESDIFNKYPKILKDKFSVSLITDTLKAMTMDLTDPITAEDLIKRRLKQHHHAVMAPAKALTNLADALPAIGIVVAVLGVIKTMASVDSPPAILGAKVGSALVGTMLGVFLSYGLVGPLSKRLEQIEENDGAFYNVIANMLVAIIYDDKPLICVEKGRSCIPDGYVPPFNDIEEKTRDIRI